MVGLLLHYCHIIYHCEGSSPVPPPLPHYTDLLHQQSEQHTMEQVVVIAVWCGKMKKLLSLVYKLVCYTHRSYYWCTYVFDFACVKRSLTPYVAEN